MDERERKLSSAQGILGRKSYGKSARGKHLPWVRGGSLSLQAAHPRLSPGLHPRYNSYFTAFRQKSDRAAHLTLDVLTPALLLGEIFQGTANLLSSAPAEELRHHGPLPKHRPRQDTRRQDCLSLYSSGSRRQGAMTQGFVRPLSGSRARLGKLLLCRFEIKRSSRVSCNK